MSKISDDEKNGVGMDSVLIAKQFAGQYRSGAQGAEIDCDSAMALALAIDDILSALTNTDLSLRAENERLRAQVEALMAERTSLIETKREQLALMQVDVTRAEWRAVKAEAKLEEAAKVLEPFANYMGESGDLDNKGQPLPDAEGVGWVYLTQGDFRAAKSFLANLKGAE